MLAPNVVEDKTLESKRTVIAVNWYSVCQSFCTILSDKLKKFFTSIGMPIACDVTNQCHLEDSQGMSKMAVCGGCNYGQLDTT